MAERSWIVGSAPDCDIRVESSMVSSHHCRLTQRGESFLLEDLLSTNGTFVDSEPISGPRIVRRGDRVTLGRNVPLVWPPPVRSVTIGRSPENDIVIPLDVVSSQHAQLEQIGSEVYLVDANSTNGTAVNDLLNKITKTKLLPTDVVYFGTHRVAATDLLKSLPREVEQQATVLEATATTDLERELSGATREPRRDQGAETFGWESFRSRASWLWGVGLSLLCAALILVMPTVLRSGSHQPEEKSKANIVSGPAENRSATDLVAPLDKASAPPIVAAQPNLKLGELSKRGEANVSESHKDLPPPANALSESISRSEEAVGVVGIRVDKQVVLTSVTVWACSANEIVCPTSILEQLESEVAKNKKQENRKGLDATLVVCTPRKTLAMLDHTAGHGAAEGISIAKLEAPLDAYCDPAPRIASFEPGQTLTMLNCVYERGDDPTTILRKRQPLKLDRIQRGADKSPLLLYCTGDVKTADVLGSPVFDATGAIAGCVRPSAGDIEIVPISQLRELTQTKP